MIFLTIDLVFVYWRFRSYGFWLLAFVLIVLLFCLALFTCADAIWVLIILMLDLLVACDCWCGFYYGKLIVLFVLVTHLIVCLYYLTLI